MLLNKNKMKMDLGGIIHIHFNFGSGSDDKFMKQKKNSWEKIILLFACF